MHFFITSGEWDVAEELLIAIRGIENELLIVIFN